jgi:purine-binding chemotaxis protein CheW
MKKARSKYSSPDFQFIRFRLSGHEFGLDVSAVREIIKYRAPEVGEYPSFTEGFIRVRSILVPVIDLKKKFSLPPSPLESSMIIVSSVDSLIAGLIVDAISDITPGARDLTSKPTAAGFPWDHLVDAEVESEGSRVLILNAESILTPEEKAALSGPLALKETDRLKAEMSLKKPGFV